MMKIYDISMISSIDVNDKNMIFWEYSQQFNLTAHFESLCFAPCLWSW